MDNAEARKRMQVWLSSLDLDPEDPIDCGLPEVARRDPAQDPSLEDDELEASMSQLRAAVERKVGPPKATSAPHRRGEGAAPPSEDGPAGRVHARSRPEEDLQVEEEDITADFSTAFLSEISRSLGGGNRFFLRKTGSCLLI